MKDIKAAILLLVLFTILCGGFYPVAVTTLAHALFPDQAAGSLIINQKGTVLGSTLIGQPFSDPKYFWPRPSATSGFSYNPLASGGSNAGPTNPDYLRAIGERVQAFRAAGMNVPVPADLAQASASGLDPHISPDAARAQIPRVARARGIDEEKVAAAVASCLEGRQFGLLGAPRVNVLALNLQMDTITP